MAGGYEVPKTGVDGVIQKLNNIQRQIDALRSAAPLSSAVISDPADGSRMFLGNGNILMWDDYATNPEGFGRIYTDPVADLHIFRMFPPYSDGNGLQNSITLRGSAPGTPGAFWIYTDGVLALSSDQGTSIIAGGSVSIVGGTGVDLDSGGRFTITELPSVGSPDYALGYDTADGGTTWSVVLDSSSKRYKADITAVGIPDAFLDIEPVTFYDKRAMSESPETASLKFGAIAEQVHDLGLGELLVTYRDDEPDALKYPMFAVALIPFVRKQRDEIAELKAEVAELKAANTTILARLDALESN